MKDIYCYIIHSDTLNKFYVGYCQNSLKERIEKHNSHFYSNKNFTAKASDWKLFLMINTNEASHARRLELKIKSMKSSKYINNLKLYPDLVAKIHRETLSN